MLSPNISSRSRISRIIIYAIATTTILFLSAAGSNVAVLSFSDPGSRTASILVACTQPPSGLVSWWTGDGHSRDTRGTNHGTLMNGATYATGEVGNGFGFDGSNQYLSIPQTANLPVRGTNDFTIEAWVKHSGGESNEGFNVFAYKNGGQDIQFLITRTQIAIWGTGAAGMIILTNHGVNAATWNHYAFTRSGNTWRVYVNANQVGGDATSAVNILTPTTPQNIGTTGLANTQFAHGMIDEIGIYDRALLQTEMQAIYASGTAGKCRTPIPAPIGLVSWWSGQGNTIDSRSRNDGVLQNGAGYAAGMSGQGFSLHGVNDYLEIPHSDSLNLAGGLTLEAWFMQRTVGYGVLFSKADNNGSQSQTSYGLQVNPDGSLNCALYGTYPADNWNTQPGLVVIGQWYHTAMTWDGTYSNANNVKLYLNGTLVQSWTKSQAPLNLVNQSITIGSMKPPTYYGDLDGLIDEPSILNRALSESEIQKIVNAGSAGKITPTAVIPPSGLVGWWGGDGDTNDYSPNANTGTQAYGPAYSVGKVGQSFNFDGIAQHSVEIAVSGPPFDPGSSEFSVDLWMKSRSSGANTYLVGKSRPDSGEGWDIRLNDNMIRLVGVNGWGFNLDSDASVTPNTWHHIAMSSTTSLVRLYVDGVLKGTCPRNSISATANPLRFGHTTNYGGPAFDGQMDEIGFFNRAITPAEIQSIYNAGIAGKLRSVITPANALAEQREMVPDTSLDIPGIQLGDATVTLPLVSTGGVTQQIPLDPAKLPPLPMGATPTGLTYDIATSAIWSGTPSICFNLPALSSVYRNLRILHLENGVWVNRTQVPGVNPILCTYGLTSLSPFTIADFGPTAATVSVSGRVLTVNGNGVLNAIVQLTDQLGSKLTARTSSLGYYRFDDVMAGETYVIGVASKRFVFTPRTIIVSEELTDVDLVAVAP